MIAIGDSMDNIIYTYMKMSLSISYTMNTHNELLKSMTEKDLGPRDNLNTVVKEYSFNQRNLFAMNDSQYRGL